MSTTRGVLVLIVAMVVASAHAASAPSPDTAVLDFLADWGSLDLPAPDDDTLDVLDHPDEKTILPANGETPAPTQKPKEH